MTPRPSSPRVAGSPPTSAVANSRDSEWRRSVLAELGLVPKVARHTLPALLRQKLGSRPTLLHVAQFNAEQQPDGLALEMGDTRYSWRELDELTSRIAHTLAAHGIRKGDVVALLGANSPLYVAIVLGCTRAGATAAMINNNLQGRPLSHAVTTGKAKLMVVEAGFMLRVEQRADLASLPRLSFGRRTLEASMAASPPQPFPPAQMSPDDDYVYIYTSGTTGLPKPCRISHARAMAGGAVFGPLMFGLRPGDKLYCVLPFYHGNALILAWGSCIVMGIPCAMRESFSASRFWSDVKRYQATAIMYIGELCRYLVNTSTHPDEAANTVRVAVGNGLRSDVWGPFQERFGIDDVREFYGATEAPAMIFNFSGKRGAVGRLPLGGMGWLKIVRFDVDSEEHVHGPDEYCIECGPDEPGELLVNLDWIKMGATEFRGYTDLTATRKKVLTDVFRKGDRYFRSGDLLRRDARGFYYFVDRIGDTFRWRGENVSTAEVTDELSQAESVAKVTVVGVRVPGEEGACGLAAVVPEGELDLDALSRAARSLPSHAQPRFVRVLSELDTTATFKVQKARLKREGVDPTAIGDPLFVLQGGEYVPLTDGLYADLGTGAVRL